MQLADKIESQDYQTSSRNELLAYFKDYFSAYEKTHVPGWVQNASDMHEMLFSNKLLAILKSKATSSKSSLKPSNAFSTLTTPLQESFMQKEHEALLQILLEIENDQKLLDLFKTMEVRHLLNELDNRKIGAKMKEHARLFGWLGYGYIGPNWDEGYFLELLCSLVRQGAKAQKLLDEIEEKKRKLAIDQKEFAKELQLTEYEQKLFEVARGFVFAKGFRKDSMFKYYSRVEPLYAMIAGLRYAPVSDFRFCYPHEADQFASGKLDISVLRNRREFSICESRGKYSEDFYLEGQKARDWLLKLEVRKETADSSGLLEGTCASPGRVSGIVRIVNVAKDMVKISKGEILVSISTNPDLVPAMKKAAAIVTDMGGITSHAAIVSRELNVPCVVGTKIATKTLKDGYLVDVDATHGRVRIIRK
ncbi:hypothetical protein HY989_04965 [Candidatus Micrarchaeota archaeon]|nr:hypothetical protein [Candidatus Micrarchaeota archaeon]